MIIRNKQTGEVKYIPDNEAGQYGVTAESPVVDNRSIMDKIIGFISPSTQSTIKDVKATGQMGNFLDQTESNTQDLIKNALALRQANQTGNTQQAQQLAQQGRNISSQPKAEQPIFSESTLKAQANNTNPLLSYLDRSLATAGEVAPLVAGFSPGLIGAKMTGAGAGLASGIVSGLTREGKTAGERATGAVIGGATGFAVGKVLDKLLGGGVKQTGENIRQSVSKPKVSASPYGAAEETKIAKGLQDLGFKGSAKSQYKQLGPKMTELSGKIDDILSTSKGSIKSSKVVSAVDDALDDVVNFDKSIPGYQQAKEKFVNQILKSANNGKLDAKSLFNAKQNLSSQLSNAFKKLAKGTALTPAEETGMAIWTTLDDLITAAEPAVKTQTALQSILYKASSGLQSNIGKGGLKIPILGNVGSQQIQSSKDLIGRLLSKAPSNTNLAPTLSPMLQNILNAPGQSTSGTTTGIDQTITQPTQTQPTQQQGILSEEKYKMLAMADMQLTGGKNLAKLKQIYEIGGNKLSTADQKRKTALDQAETVYNLVEQLALNAPTGVKGAGGALLGKIPGVSGGNVEELDRITDGLAKAIAGALAGEVGVATDKDVERWKGLMPKPGDTMDDRKRALKNLRNAITNGRQLISTSSGDTDPLQSLLNSSGT